MRELAAFAFSDSGKTYAQVCQFWGLDPAAFLQEDDVLAHNLRAALAVSLAPEREEADDEGSKHAALVQQARRGAAAIGDIHG